MTYLANDKYSATLSTGYTAGDTTLYVSSVPTNVPTIVVAAKGTDNETVFAVTGKTTNSLTGVSRLRGANVDLDATTPITCLNNEEFVNQYEDAAKDVTSLSALIYAADGGSTDTYAISLDPAPSAYTTGMVVAFKANTANTGAASLNVNSLGAKTIKKNYNEDLASSDIKANQIVTVVYDGTNFQLVSHIPGAATMTNLFSVCASTTQAVTKSTITDVTFGTEGFDPGSNFASNVFTVPTTGYYYLCAKVRLVSPEAAADLETWIYNVSTTTYLDKADTAASAGNATDTIVSGVYYLTAGNTIGVRTRHGSSVDKNISGDGTAGNSSTFSGHFISA